VIKKIAIQPDAVIVALRKLTCQINIVRSAVRFSVMKQKKPVKSDLEKENRELKNQLAEVQKQLTEVLKELKKLRNNSTGQNKAELDQQIDYNEKLIRHGEEVPVAEIKEQVQKSQALMNELNTTDSPTKVNKGDSLLPYVIGGSVILVAAGIIGYLLVKKSKRK